MTRLEVGRRLAALKGFAFGGVEDRSGLAARASAGPAATASPRCYHLPCDTLVGIDHARALGIVDEHDLFGGAVPWPFAATKAISHPLVEPGAAAPDGWPHALGSQLARVTLAGFTAFDLGDARRAGLRLLERGPVRVKQVRATGGHGQTVVRDARALDAALAALEDREIAVHGIALEENLTEVVTWSVGQVRVDALVVSYWGTQQLTPDNAGASVYGGSDLRLVRGGFEQLLAEPMPDGARRAIEQARVYDAAAQRCLPGFIASRRNYDVAEGVAADGTRRTGVLEQSWRIGGASGPEIAALQAFHAVPTLARLRARSVEVFGDTPPPPPGAVVYFRGDDPSAGPLTKYTVVDAGPDA